LWDLYEGDIVYGDETDEYGSRLSSWTGLIEYVKDKGRLMIVDDLGNHYEIDDFEFEKCIGNIKENLGMFMVIN